jgi:hypothetical protein
MRSGTVSSDLLGQPFRAVRSALPLVYSNGSTATRELFLGAGRAAVFVINSHAAGICRVASPDSRLRTLFSLASISLAGTVFQFGVVGIQSPEPPY